MPTSPATSRQQRQQRILDLIAAEPLHSQAELQELLADEGMEVNQATLSRDIRDLGLVKDSAGYRLPSEGSNGHPAAELRQALRRHLTQVLAVQHQVLLKTHTGGAQPLALALDLAEVPDVLGTLAGDDTILIICANQTKARKVARDLQKRGQS
ncbi:MAG: arginine repressor [Planctomycetota bacterium]|jgi:transcriptional regulator of arginine metabolism